MASIEITEKAAKFVDSLIENAEKEKTLIADALTTAVESMDCQADDEEYLNICSVLGRYNRLISLLS
jgi:hypothetical protein